MQRARPALAALAGAWLALATAPLTADPGTPEQRAALFDELLDKTLRRTAFSPAKPATLGLPAGTTMAEHVRSGMLAMRDEVVGATTDMELFWALSAVSNVRRDHHLGVAAVEGGLRVETDFYGPGGEETGHAPIKFKPDYSDPAEPTYFVSDVSEDPRASGMAGPPEIGDVLVAVNGRPAPEYTKLVGRYLTSSTNEALWWSISNVLPIRFYGVPPTAYRTDRRLHLTLAGGDGAEYDLELPYLPYREIDWANYEDHPFYGSEAQRAEALRIDPYPGYELVSEGRAFDVYRSVAVGGPLLVRWHRFRSALLEEIPRLLDYAEAEGLKDAGLIWDGTRSTGGSRGAWVLQRLQPRPFKMTFGNLRISDVTQGLADRLAEYAREGIEQAGADPAEQGSLIGARVQTIDPGHFLLDWLEADVYPAIDAGLEYTSSVPFKSYFLPRDSDGVVQPADRHLTGPMALLLGPYGCSHLDQFAAMFIDNDLGYSVGMPAGGCSNTWEHEETLTFPGTGTPVVTYRWTAGQTTRPNGEVLEGNPAQVRDSLPLTRGNYIGYSAELLRRAEAYVASERARRARVGRRAAPRRPTEPAA